MNKAVTGIIPPVITAFDQNGAFNPELQRGILRFLLPHVQDERDQCVQRLNEWLLNREGIEQSHIERENGEAVVCLHYDANLVSLLDVRRLAEQAGAAVANRYHHELIPIEGMDCSDCVVVLEHGIGRMDGVLAANASYTMQVLQVEYDVQKTSRAAIERRVWSLGYEVPATGLRSWYRQNRELLFVGLAGVFTLILTESNEPVGNRVVYNPIDTLPRKNKLSADYARAG